MNNHSQPGQEQQKEPVMKKLLEDKQYFILPKLGDLVKGTVVAIDKNAVYLDLNGVATGIIRGRERFGEAEEYKNLKIGDELEATVLELENENGELELSFRYAGRQKSWQNVKSHIQTGQIIPALITDANKGGLMIRVENLNGFLPVSQLAPEHYPRVPGGDKNRILEILKSYIGQKFEVKVLDANDNEEKLIISEKAAWEETQKDVMSKYQIGSVVEGVITAVTDFGVFVEFNDKLEGLVHISEIAWQRIDDPNNFVKVGQKVKAEIIGIEGSKIFLSMKKLLRDPWSEVERKYQVGQKVKGKILKINPFGLFVELDQDIHGLAHVSALSEKSIENINDFAKIGEEKDFYIISIEPTHHRLGLSLLPPKDKITAENQETASAPAAEKSEPIKNEEPEKKKIAKKKAAKKSEVQEKKVEKTEPAAEK